MEKPQKHRKKRQFQPSLDLGPDHARRREHGGDHRKGRRKLARPIDPKRPMHVVFRAVSARGELSLLHPRNVRKVNERVHNLARRYGIRIYRFSNNGDHLHAQIYGRTREGIQNFLRVTASQIALLITGARKGLAYGRYWAKLAFTSIVEWGAHFRRVAEYVELNQMEAQLGRLHEYRKRTKRKRSHPENPLPARAASR